MEQPEPGKQPITDETKPVPCKFFSVGTPACGAAGAVLGIIVALLLIFFGLWKTLFIVIMACIGAFCGGVAKKSEWLKNVINKTFPPKS